MLLLLSKILKDQGYSIWSYSGYTFEKLCEDPKTYELLKLIDVLVDGPYIQSMHSMDIDFRGSSNQRIIDVQKSLKENKVIFAEGFI